MIPASSGHERGPVVALTDANGNALVKRAYGPCGRGAVIRRICGRRRDMPLLSDGNQLWPRFDCDDFAKAAPVRRFRLAQRALAEI